MAKSFKRAIACILAVLMVAFAAPMNAFAIQEIADYHPDLDIMFWTYYNTADGLWNDPGTPGAAAEFDYCGVYDVPLAATTTKDTTNGSLKVSKLELTSANTAAMAALYETDPVDYTYTTGDMFLATVVVKNVSDLCFLSAALSYSDNIEPAGLYSYKNGRKTEYAWGSESERAAANSGTWMAGKGGTGYLAVQSAEGIYGTSTFLCESCEVVPEDNYMFIEVAGADGTYKTVAPASSPDPSVPFIDPTNGDDSGYTYTDTIILVSFVFKITGTVSAANPIEFGVYDPTNAEFTQSYEGGSYSVLDPKPKNYATYAEDTASAASEKFTFFGMNTNSGEGCGGGGETHTHTMTPYAANAATCTTAGNSAYWYCADCGKYFSDAEGNTEIQADSWVIPATGHTPAAAVTENNVNPTCTAGGSYDSVVYCSVCNAELSRETINVPANGHSYAEVVTAPTCTEAGYTTYTCSVCGDTYTGNEVAALGHDFGEWTVITEATEEHNGLKRRECSRCDAYEEDVIPALEHTHVAGEAAQENVVPATCTEAGSYDLVVRCTKCNEIMESTPQTIPALGHDLGEWAVVTAATCTDAGEEARSCSRCDYVETQPIPATGHSYVDNDVAATCTEGGYTSHVCSVCGDSYTDNETPALGHDLGEWAVVTAATCTEAGEEARSCSRCDYVETQPIPATGHTWGDWAVVTPATINSEGEEARECSVCHATETRAIAKNAVKVTVAATEGGSVSGSVASGETGSFQFGDTYTLEATAESGYEFVTWMINGKSVGKSTTYNGKAFSDVTVEPIFAKESADSFTVVFFDLYNTVVSEQTVSKAEELEVPSAEKMARQGYTFTGWDIDPTTVTAAAQITGQYEVATIGYAVNITGTDNATINGEATTSKDNVPYDSRVTVYAEGATGWKIGDTVVSTDATYSFYLGSDVTLEAVFTDVEAQPAITIISESAVAGSYRHIWVATRVVPAGYSVEKVGFVYGKNVEDDELVLDNAGKSPRANSIIRVGYNNVTSVLETSLQYGLSAQEGKMNAKAFMIVKKAGVTSIIYSDAVSYTYGQDSISSPDD